MTAAANLLFIVSDNHNRQVTGCYGHPIVRTPALDKLAARGTRFAHSYAASALCVPSRASLATGRYVHQNGCWDNAIAYDGRIPSWMHRMRDASIEIAAIGKLHYRSAEDDNGFSEEITPMHLDDGQRRDPQPVARLRRRAAVHRRRALEALRRTLGRRGNPLPGLRSQDHGALD